METPPKKTGIFTLPFLTKNHPLPLPAMQDELENNNREIQDNSDELYERFSITIDKGQEPLRIDKFLSNRIEGATRNKLQQAINHDMVLVNGKAVRPNYKVKPHDQHHYLLRHEPGRNRCGS